MRWSVYSRVYESSTGGKTNLLFSTESSSATNTIYSPSLDLELNKAGQFSFTIQPGHLQYDNLYPMRTLILVYIDDELIFRGRIIDVKVDFYKQKSITCESDLAFLLDSICHPFVYTNEKDSGSDSDKGIERSGEKTIEYVFGHIVAQHNAQVEQWKRFETIGSLCTVTKDNSSSIYATDEFDNNSYSDCSSALNSNLLEAYGGVLRTRTVGETTYLDYVKDPSQDISQYTLNPQEIHFAVNLLNVNRSYPISDIFTVLLPIGKDNLRISSVNSGSEYLEDAAAIARFGRIVKCETWSEVDSASTLKAKATKFLADHAKIYADDLEVKAVDLHILDSSVSRIKIGDRVRCYSEPHGIDETLVCLQIKYDLFNPENNTYKIGSFVPSTNHKDKIKKNSSTSSRGGSGSKGKGISSKGAGTSKALDQSIEKEVLDNRTQIKNAMMIVGNRVRDLKTGEYQDLEEKDLIDLHNNLQLPEYTDYDGNKVQVKDLCSTTEDVLITARNIALIAGGDVEIHADGSIDLTAVGDLTAHSNRIQINADDIAEINARKIQIGGPNTELITINAETIDLTGHIEALIVDKLNAQTIDSIRLGASGYIQASNIVTTTIQARNYTIIRTVEGHDVFEDLPSWILSQANASASSNINALESRVSALENAGYMKWSQTASVWMADPGGTQRLFLYVS